MRILILGGDGMLGHRLFSHLIGNHEVKSTLRQDIDAYSAFGLFRPENSYTGIDVCCPDRLIEVMADFHPEAVVNAAGIVKQRPSAKESIPTIEINSLFPHRLAALCQVSGARLIHLSTDCVFSGRKGNYCEDDVADAEDLYGRSKLLGEVETENSLTLRTSIIGRELSRKASLLEWFLSQEGDIRGYRRAIFSGFTTIELSRVIELLIVRYPDSHGLYHLSSAPISKFDLLTMIKKELDHPVTIKPDTDFNCDRSLDSTKFRKEFNYSPPTWKEMISELCEDLK